MGREYLILGGPWPSKQYQRLCGLGFQAKAIDFVENLSRPTLQGRPKIALLMLAIDETLLTFAIMALARLAVLDAVRTSSVIKDIGVAGNARLSAALTAGAQELRGRPQHSL